MARRLAAAGAEVTWFTARARVRPRRGHRRHPRPRSGRHALVYPRAPRAWCAAAPASTRSSTARTASRSSPRFRRGGRADRAGRPPRAPGAVRPALPAAAPRWGGCWRAGDPRVYGRRAVAAVSPSTRQELRKRLHLPVPIHVVPNGSVAVPNLTGHVIADPTVVVVGRLVPHKRIDLLLDHRTATRRVPGLAGRRRRRRARAGTPAGAGHGARPAARGHLPRLPAGRRAGQPAEQGLGHDRDLGGARAGAAR